jgi:hypothetical protein
MSTNATLFYSEANYRKALRVLERVSKHILWKFAVVGGIANRAMYPEWGEMNQGKKFNDLDVVLLPTPKDERTSPLAVRVKDDFLLPSSVRSLDILGRSIKRIM